MPKRGLPLPVVAVSFAPLLGDVFAAFGDPFHDDAAAGQPVLTSLRPALSLVTPTDVLAEARWMARNRTYWQRYRLAKPPREVAIPEGYRTRFDGKTLDEIMAFGGDDEPKETPAAEVGPFRAAALLLLAWRTRFGDEPVDVTSPEAAALFVSACEAATIPTETSELEIALALLEIDDSLPPALLVFVARALVRAGMLERAEETLASADDADALVLAADVAEAQGKKCDAVEKVVTAVARDIETLGAMERVERWKRAINRASPRPTIAVVVNGTPWRVSFQTRAILGRVDADVVVPSPLVSRRQVEFFEVNGVPHLADPGSTHGTCVGRNPLGGPIAVDSTIVLGFAGGTIQCTVRPGAHGGMIVEAPTGLHLLALGSRACVDGWILVRAGGRLSISHSSGAVRSRGDDTSSQEAEAAPGDIFEAYRGDELRVDAESFYDQESVSS